MFDTSTNAAGKYIAVDTLRHLLAVHITPANEQEKRAQVSELAQQVQHATSHAVKAAFAMLMLVHAIPVVQSLIDDMP